MEKQLGDSFEERNWGEFINILSKNDKLAEKYLSVFVEGEFSFDSSSYLEHVGKVTEANENSSNHLFQIFKETRTGLQTYFDNNNKELTPEERMNVGNQILE